MRFCIIGFGYWGKILYENLKCMGYSNIIICENNPKQIEQYQFGDKTKIIKDYKKIECSHIFIATPASTHFEICHDLLGQTDNIFCEKPLTVNLKQHNRLQKKINTTSTNLFVDWIFQYNKGIDIIKEYIEQNGPPESIIMNRLNFGPIRTDVNARLDLASHDISILQKILPDEKPTSIQWYDFHRGLHTNQKDSTVGLLCFENTHVQINTSWHFGFKDRKCYFDFKHDTLEWNDITKTIVLKKEHQILDVKDNPLQNAIQQFLNGVNTQEQMNNTYQIMKILYDKI